MSPHRRFGHRLPGGRMRSCTSSMPGPITPTIPARRSAAAPWRHTRRHRAGPRRSGPRSPPAGGPPSCRHGRTAWRRCSPSTTPVWSSSWNGPGRTGPGSTPARHRRSRTRSRPPDRIAGALGHWCFDTATPVVAGTWAAARAAVDVALTAADLVASGEPAAYGLCRPPGHHAARAAFGGYCYLNNAAVAAHWLSGHTGDRISVLDIDFHHGNGTQQIFYHRPDVQYVSLHGDPDRAFPYVAGYADETGAGAGLGTTLNIPLPAGVDDDGYLAALERALAAVDSFDPAIVVVSLGADTAAADPLGDLMLTLDGSTCRPWCCRRADTRSPIWVATCPRSCSRLSEAARDPPRLTGESVPGRHLDAVRPVSGRTAVRDGLVAVGVAVTTAMATNRPVNRGRPGSRSIAIGGRPGCGGRPLWSGGRPVGTRRQPGSRRVGCWRGCGNRPYSYRHGC